MKTTDKELNLAKILKDCPKGTELYSTVYGVVYFEGISSDKNATYQIFYSDDITMHSATSNGRVINNADAECCLFPSKENRDWSTFKSHIKRFDPKGN